MKIRKATVRDITAINDLFWELDSDAIRFQPEHFQRCERTEKYLTELIESEKTDFLLAILDDMIVGFSLIFEKEIKNISLLVPCKYGYIQDFVVTKKYRNKGVGTQLINASKQWAQQRNLDYLKLSVFPENTDGIRFYKRNGLAEQMISMECPL